MSYNKIKLLFAHGLEIEFTDRERALKQVEELTGKGTRYPVVVLVLKAVVKVLGLSKHMKY